VFGAVGEATGEQSVEQSEALCLSSRPLGEAAALAVRVVGARLHALEPLPADSAKDLALSFTLSFALSLALPLSLALAFAARAGFPSAVSGAAPRLGCSGQQAGGYKSQSQEEMGAGSAAAHGTTP